MQCLSLQLARDALKEIGELKKCRPMVVKIMGMKEVFGLEQC